MAEIRQKVPCKFHAFWGSWNENKLLYIRLI